MTNFPTAKDSYTHPNPNDPRSGATSLSTQFSNIQDAVSALETKVGIDASADTSSQDYKLSGVTGSDKAASKTGAETLTNKTLTAPKINLGSDAAGDIYYRASDGTFTRLPAGTAGQILDINASTGLPEWIPNPSAADATYTVKGVDYKKANAEYYAADAGSTDAYAITLSPAPTAYATGQEFSFKANTVNTGAATLNVNGLGAKTIVKGVNTTLADGDIAAGQICVVKYDGINFVLLNPVTASLSPITYTVNADEKMSSWFTTTIPAFGGATGYSPWTGTWGSITIAGNYGTLGNTNHGGSDTSDRGTNLMPSVSTKGYRVKFLSKLALTGSGSKIYQFGFASDNCYFYASDTLGTTTLRCYDGSNNDITVSSLNSTWNLYEIAADSAGVTKFYLNGTLIFTSASHKSLSSGNFSLSNSGSGSSQDLSQITMSIEL